MPTSNAGLLLALKAGATATTILLTEHVSKRNPVASMFFMVAVNSAYAMIVAHNYMIARR
jgi:hypothetical protein